MKLSQLKAIVKKGESEILEFKKTTAELSAALQTVCAFLNSEAGGTVLIGVTDDGKIVGQTVSDKTQKEIAGELSKIEPNMTFDINYVPVTKELSVIVIMVKPGDKAPYVYEGRPYLRSQSTTRKMSQETYEYLFHKKRPTIWEKKIAYDCTINSLDKSRIREFVRTAIAENRLSGVSTRTSILEILTKLKLIDNNQLTNAAVVLFGKDQNRQTLQAARFNGTDKQEFLDNKAFHGNAFDLYDKALEFLGNHLPIAGRIEEGNPYRIDTPVMPYKVLREAIANAICHRDYHSNGNITLAIYDDRIEINNPGGLPPGITIAELKKIHESIPRNELIADVFFKCHLIERWGRGTTDMVNFCKKADVPTPKFEDHGYYFSVILRFKESIRYVTPPQEKNEDMPIMLTDRQKAILEILKRGLLSREQIMEKLKDEPAARTLQKDLLKLYTLDLIIKSGSSTGRFVKWALNQEFNAPSTRPQRAPNAPSARTQYELNANSTRTQRELNANLMRSQSEVKTKLKQTKQPIKTKKIARKKS